MRQTTRQSWILFAALVALLVAGAWGARSGVLARPAPADLAPAAAQPVNPLSKIEQSVWNDTANGQSAPIVVLLSEQANLTAAYKMQDQDARGWYVYNTLTNLAGRTQVGLIAFLRAQGAQYQSYWAANMIVTNVDRTLLNSLAARTDVARIESNRSTRWIEDPAVQNASAADVSPDAIEWGVQRVNAPAVWALGYTGQGIVVGNQDTGMLWTHNALKNHYRGWNGTTADHNYNWWDSIHTGGGACGANSQVPCDDHSHGSHTTGTMVGDDGAGNQIGVAPGAKWIGCRNMDQGNGQPSTYTECFQFFIAPTNLAGQNPNPALRPHAMNNSWGCPASEGCAAGTLETIVNNTQAAGIFVEASAGNSGPGCSSVSDPPALYSAAFSTGAIDINNGLAGFSSRGPSLFYTPNLLKPEISAPGVNVRSATNGGNTSYANFSGTSMAGPHVVGVVALLWSAVPSLSRNISATKTLLEQTANPQVVLSPVQTCGGIPSSQIPNNSFGYGRVDVLAAVNAAGGSTPTPTGVAGTPTRTPTPQGTVCAPQVLTGAITANDSTHNGYVDLITGGNLPSVCGVPETCPGTDPTGTFHYDTYSLTNTSGGSQCITVDVNASGCGARGIWVLAYLTSYDPNNVCSNYLASAGADEITTSQTFSFNVPAGATYVLEIEEYFENAGCTSYTLTVTQPCATPTPAPSTPSATATAPTQATATATVCAITFSDVDQNNPFYSFIRCLACRNIISGYSDGTFRWGADVTRGQLAKIVANASGLTNAIPSTQQTFEDVSNTNPFWLFAERLAGPGYIAGYTCGGAGEPCVPPGNRPYFRPGNSATRGQISKIDALAAHITDTIPTTQQTFQDVPSSHPFWLWVEQLSGRSVISGYGCGGAGEPCVPPGNKPYFRAAANTTRGQLSKIAAQTFFPGCSTPSR